MNNLIDTHIHIWNLSQVEYPWLKGNTSILNRTYDLSELEPQRKAAGVTAGILVQAANSAEDTTWMIRTAESHPWITGVVGWLPLQDPDATARILEESYTPEGILKGVRHLIHDEPDPRWLLQDSVLESLGLLAAKDIPYDLVGVLPAHIETALRVAGKWPDLRMVFDHCNQPPIGRIDRSWEAQMTAAATHQNFYVKLSGLTTAAKNGDQWTTAGLEPSIEFMLKHFGTHRCFCGGDWPVSLLAGSYERTWSAYQSTIERLLDPQAQAQLLYQNAERFYRLSTRDGQPQ
jgi:L-fuconolactonase